MKKTIYILLFCLATTISAQDNRNIFVGRYAGIAKQTNTPGGTFYDYNALADIVYGDSTYQFVFFYDSCAWATNWTGATGQQQAWPDSTIRSWGNPNYIYGQLFSNDSLYFTYTDVFGATTSQEEFFGFKLYSTVGIKDLGKHENEILISPQPASDLMYIQSVQVLFKSPPILYDLNGHQIKIGMLYINSNTYKFDVSNLNAGMYFIVVQGEKGFIRKKIIVQ